jgi:hypothetical protein
MGGDGSGDLGGLGRGQLPGGQAAEVDADGDESHA